MGNKLDTKALYAENRDKFATFIKSATIQTCKAFVSGNKYDVKTKDGQLKYVLNRQDKIAGDVELVAIKDKDNRFVYFDMTNGLFLEKSREDGIDLVEWISIKSNNRRYQFMQLEDKGILVADYWLMVALAAVVWKKDEYIEMFDTWVNGKEVYRKWTKAEMEREGYLGEGEPYNDDTALHGYIHDDFEINHIDGDTYNCAISNLEVVTSYLNSCHSRLMSEISHYYPEVVEIVGIDCKGNVMHRFTDKTYRIDCSMIDNYNETHSKGFDTKYKEQLKEAAKLKREANKILSKGYVSGWSKEKAEGLLAQSESLREYAKAYETRIAPYKDSKGEFRPRFSKEQIDDILVYFGLPIPERVEIEEQVEEEQVEEKVEVNTEVVEDTEDALINWLLAHGAIMVSPEAFN